MLYKVKATYKYQAEDMDELQFEVGEIIDVVEYEDPEEQVKQFCMASTNPSLVCLLTPDLSLSLPHTAGFSARSQKGKLLHYKTKVYFPKL